MKMKIKLNCILFVDDDPDCNFFHQRMVSRMEIAEKVFIVKDGVEAIAFLSKAIDGEFPNPSILFLDINMPRMDGWAFLEAYDKLPDSQKAQIVLVMLTTSLNQDDKERGLNNPYVKGFYNKYLDEETFWNIIHQHFPNNL